MKINSKWVSLNIIFIVLIVMMGLFSYFIFSVPDFPKELILIKIIPIIIIIMSIVLIFTNNEKYKSSYLIPKETFLIHRYKNFDVWTYKNDSWICRYDKEKYFNKTHIKATTYYNRKKEKVSFKLDLPNLPS